MHVYPGTGSFRSRELYLIALALALSLLIHLIVIYCLPTLSRPPPDVTLKKPVWVDLVKVPEEPSVLIDEETVTDSDALEPGSLAPEVIPPVPPAPPPQPVPERASAPRPSPPAKRLQAKAPAPAEKPKEIPPVKDLIPSMQNLLGFQQPPKTSFEALHLGPRQDGRGNRAANAQFEKYLMELKRKVERNWTVSMDAGLREGSTVIYVIVAADGTLWSVDILKPSGMIVHDYEALEAVKRAFPLPPPPEELLNDQQVLPIRFSFHYLLTPG